jgi:hypothetical protein
LERSRGEVDRNEKERGGATYEKSCFILQQKSKQK